MKPGRKPKDEGTGRVCNDCGEWKPIDCFVKKANGKHRTECKPCRNEQHRAYRLSHLAKFQEYGRRWREKHAEHVREHKRLYNLRRPDVKRNGQLAKYQIKHADYEAILKAQGGGCAICGGQCASGRRLAVDHVNLPSGKPFVRGLLCVRCNTVVGSTREEIDEAT